MPSGGHQVIVAGKRDAFVVQKAKEQGDFLLVGLHTDEDVAERRGPHLPIMDLHERCLSVLACKYVDEAIIGTPTLRSLRSRVRGVRVRKP